MDLFGPTPEENLLPCDGTVHYHGPVMSVAEARAYEHLLLETIPWKNDALVIFGKALVTARKVAWYGDTDFSYTYSGTTKQALAWTSELRTLKARVEELSGGNFNSCLLNLYHDGKEGMSWHSDDEKALGRDTMIASVSFGAQRKFSFKHKGDPKKTVSVILESGSLLVMKGTTQTHWLHSVPKSLKITTPRINLTFRSIVTK